MFALSKSQLRIALFTGCLTCANLTHAFEQSSYFIFDIIESQGTAPVQGRLALPAAALTKVEKDIKSSTQRRAERSEFEIDFNQVIQGSGHESAPFTFDQPIKAPTKARSSSFSTESFGLGTSNSEFGE
ncbi:hypothetical protein ACWPKO_01365 [Coraliomargarita sp. W4R53]